MMRWGSLLLVAGVVAAVPSMRRESPPPITALVREGPFSDELIESGTFAAAQTATYGAPVGAPAARIVDIVSEGARVNAGDILIRFDTSALQTALERETQSLRNTEAERFRAVEELRVEQLRAESDVQSSRDRLASAEQTLASELDGRGRLAIAEAEAADEEARREVDRARRTYDDLKPLLAEGFVTRAEIEKAAQSVSRAETAARLVALRVKTLSEFDRPAAIAKSRAEAATARDAVGRSADVSQSRLAEARAALTLAEAHVADATARVAALQSRIAASIVRAAGEGVVMYRDAYVGAERRKPQVGDEVAANQPVLVVPETSRLLVEIHVREIDVRKVVAGSTVHVRADAFPDVSARGSIARVGALAIDDPTRAGTRVFPVTIAVDAPDPRLKPGMTARVAVTTDVLTRALVVPVDAVFESVEGAYCLVVDGRGTIRRPVAVVASNDVEAAVRGPLTPGDRVSLEGRAAAARLP